MSITKEDFNRIAKEFREVREEIKKNPELAAHVVVLYLENRLATYFREQNPRFNGEVFRHESRPENWSSRA